MGIFAAENYISFFHQVLTTPAGSLPKGAQWIASFHNLEADIVKKGIASALALEPQKWKVDRAASVISSDAYQKNAGCVFCHSIDMPGEGLTVVPEGNINSNEFLRSYVGAGRQQFPEMRATVLDTNVSFVDNVCRPWSIATAAFGLLAYPRSSSKNYRTDMYCWKIAATNPKEPPAVTMLVTFFDVCCIHVSNEEYNYQPLTTPVMREARFIYNYYSISTDESDFFLSNQPTLDLPESPVI